MSISNEMENDDLERDVLEELTALKAPDLIIKEENLLELNPNLIWNKTLPEVVKRKVPTKIIEGEDGEDKEVKEKGEIVEQDPNRVNYAKEYLKTSVLYIPIIDSDILIPISYEHKRGKDVVIYKSFVHASDYKIFYRKGNLVHLKKRKGIKVLKVSEERHFDFVPLEEEDIFLIYNHSEEDKRWYHTTDEEDFSNRRKALEELLESEDVMNTIKEFFDYKNNAIAYIEKNSLNHIPCLTYIGSLKHAISEYCKFQNAICEISDTNYEHIKKQIEELETSINEATRIIYTSTVPDFKKTEVITTLKTKIDKLLTHEAYWVDEYGVYPNLARFHNLKQKSNGPRNTNTERKLEENLKKYYKTKKKNHIPLDDSTFLTFCKDNK